MGRRPKLTFSEYGHVAYQIKADEAGSTMVTKYFAHRHTLDPGGRVKRSNYIFLGTDVSPFPNFNNSVLTTVRRNLLLHC